MTPEVIEPGAVGLVATEARQAVLVWVASNRVAVVDRVTLERAVQIRAEIPIRRNGIINALAKPKAWAFGIHKWFCGLESAGLAPLDELDGYERDEISAFKRQEDLVRERRERELAEEQRRIDDERAVAEAAALEQSGDTELAESVIAQAMQAPTPVVVLPDMTKQVQGLKFRKRWLWRLKDETQVPAEFKRLDEVKISGYVRTMRGSAVIPGIDIFSTDEPVR